MRFLTSKRDYLRVYANYKILKGNLFNFLTSKNSEDPGIGIVVSKKVGNAVVRNFIKRRIKAFLREKEFNTWDSSVDVVIISKPDTRKASWEEFKKELSAYFGEFYLSEIDISK